MSDIGQRAPQVAVVGSVNIDLVVTVERLALPGETVLAGGYTETVGGKGYNQAVAAARRVPTRLIGCVGEDPFGATAVAEAQRRGVAVDALARVGAPTGRALIEVGADGENRIVVAPLANREVTPEQVTAALDGLRPSAVLTQLEIPLAAVAAAARWCEANGARFLLNPSPAAALPAEVLGAADPLIVNEQEAADLIGSTGSGAGADPSAAAAALGRVARSAVVTAGPRGAAYAVGSDVGHVPAKPLRAVDTTGAGDEFAGTLLAALASGETLAQAVGRAIEAAAAIVVTAREER